MLLSRDDLIDLFKVGVEAADPRAAVQAHFRMHPLSPARQIFLLAFGKAACAMTDAALPFLPHLTQALVVTNYENAAALPGIELIAAGHPVPDENGLRAGQRAEELLAAAGPGDLVLVLVSGGGSALLPAPVKGVSLAEKAEVSKLLLGAGLDIVSMNAVRQYLSRFKGGGLLQLAAPASVSTLILSDVIGDDLRAIASGPTTSPIMTRVEVVAMLRSTRIWDDLPASARAALKRDDAKTAPTPVVHNHLIGSNALSLQAMARACPGARLDPAPLDGDVSEAADRIVALAKSGAGTTLLGGETTVKLQGTGLGGRNQELALRVALELEGHQGWRFLSAGTDGRDGPTDAAGAIVDGQTCAQIRRRCGNPRALLANNDSYKALHLANALLITGGTGTNVADLQILTCA
ncbi:MAG: glycerate kinase type-2 family protein [Roseinatronobacter sp.]